MQRLLLITLFTFLFCPYVLSQVDTEFWFVAPEVTIEHAESPIFLRFSAYSQDATITISQPANSAFIPITLNILANSTNSLNLTSRIGHIENRSSNSVSNKGILIKSTAEISVYYEVLGYSSPLGYVNTDIYSLKGMYALGTYFLTPFQTFWANESQNNKEAWSGFHIVASEDNTTVYVLPSKDIVGHRAGDYFTINLNKGETYYGRAVGKSAINRPAGTEIISNKPVAVTVSDDSVIEDGHYDLIGDQIVPVIHLGNEYIFIKLGNSNNEKGFICATQNSTEVYMNEQATPIANLSKGETFSFSITDPSTYVRCSSPVYAFQVSSMEKELGGALLPEILCTGSKSISFTRSTSELFGVAITVRTGFEDDFLLNGTTGIITEADFQFVPGTNGKFKTCVKFFNEIEIPPLTGHNISNQNSDFHLSIFNGDIGGNSFRYGYFSTFGKLELGEDKGFCEATATTLRAGNGKDSYLWNTNETSESITVDQPGKYWVTVQKGECTFSDTILVSEFPKPTIALGPDISFCSSQPISINASPGFLSYRWNTGETTSEIYPEQSGLYIVNATDRFGCEGADSVYVTKHISPTPEIFFLKEDVALCADSIIRVETNEGFKTYLWNNNGTDYFTYSPTNQNYSVTVTDSNNCSSTNTRTLDCSPYIEVFNLITPNNDNKNDFFVIKGPHGRKYSLEVYNRWGSKVYYNESYNNDWSPIDLADGIYYYLLDHHEGKKRIKSWFQVIR